MTSAEAASVTTHRRINVQRAIAWIAAYALALQTILGGIALHFATSIDPALALDPAAICLNSHGGGTSGDIPDNHGSGPQAGDHCAMCASSPPPLVTPQFGGRVAILSRPRR
jgi:hypothetical protein